MDNLKELPELFGFKQYCLKINSKQQTKNLTEFRAETNFSSFRDSVDRASVLFSCPDTGGKPRLELVASLGTTGNHESCGSHDVEMRFLSPTIFSGV